MLSKNSLTFIGYIVISLICLAMPILFGYAIKAGWDIMVLLLLGVLTMGIAVSICIYIGMEEEIF